jgi:hypothetical protein
MSDTWEWNVADAIEELDAGLFLIDLGFQGRKQVVAAYLLVSDDELVLIETGPGSTHRLHRPGSHPRARNPYPSRPCRRRRAAGA